MSELTDVNVEAASGKTSPTSSVEVFAFVLGYWKKLPLRFAGMLVGTSIGVILEVQIPRFSADLVIATERHLTGALGAEAAWRAAGGLLGVFAAVSVVKQLYMRNWMYFTSQVMQKLVSDGFFQVQRFSLDWHSNHFAGSTQRKVTRGMWAYDSLADSLIIDLGPALGLLIGLTSAMTLRDPMLGLYFGTSVAVFVGITIWMSLVYVAPANVLSNDADSEVGGALADAITCNTVVKSFGAEEREDSRFQEASQNWRYQSRRAWLRSMDSSAVQSILLLLLLAGLLSLVLFRVDSTMDRVEDAVYVIAAYLVVHGYLRNIGWQVRSAQRGINELDDLVEIAKTEFQVGNLVDAPDFRADSGRIRFESVCFGYENQPTPVFENLCVEIQPGEKIALVGESGSGKSTFAKLIQRLYDLDAGQIIIDDQDVSKVTQESLRSTISIVPQEPVLFHRSLAENIAYGDPSASDREIREAARKAHAHEFVERLALGYATLVGERGIKLSGGERQRVAIARAILANKPILILDEATSSLDSLTEHLIQEALSTLLKGRTAIIIAHRLSTIRQVDRILVFDAGRIIEEGTHDELMRNSDGQYRRLVEMQTFDIAQAPATSST